MGSGHAPRLTYDHRPRAGDSAYRRRRARKVSSEADPDPHRLLFLWNLFEGVPKFYRYCFKQGVLGGDRRTVLNRMFFESSSPLRSVADHWFLHELRGRYDVILKFISRHPGCASGEIEAHVQSVSPETAEQVGGYVKILIERYRMIERRLPVAPLRDRGVMVVGSGNVVHNLRALDWSQPELAFDWARRFDDAAREVLTAKPSEAPKLRGHADFARSSPTPDHYLPLLYIAGLAGAAGRPLEALTDGHAFGSISMASYTLDARCPRERGDARSTTSSRTRTITPTPPLRARP